MSNEPAGTFDAVPTERVTKDGRDVVYVSAPSLDQVEAIQELRELELEVGARIQALNAALTINQPEPYAAGAYDPAAVSEREERVLATAQRFTDFLLSGEVSDLIALRDDA